MKNSGHRLGASGTTSENTLEGYRESSAKPEMRVLGVRHKGVLGRNRLRLPRRYHRRRRKTVRDLTDAILGDQEGGFAGRDFHPSLLGGLRGARRFSRDGDGGDKAPELGRSQDRSPGSSPRQTQMEGNGDPREVLPRIPVRYQGRLGGKVSVSGGGACSSRSPQGEPLRCMQVPDELDLRTA